MRRPNICEAFGLEHDYRELSTSPGSTFRRKICVRCLDEQTVEIMSNEEAAVMDGPIEKIQRPPAHTPRRRNARMITR